jgi:PAS domain S-box-containing protein
VRGHLPMATTEPRPERKQRALAEADLLTALATIAATEDDLQRILQAALEYLRDVIAFTGSSIALVEGDDLIIQAADGPFAASALGYRLPRNTGVSWQVIDSGQPFVCNNLHASDLRASGEFQSYLAVPLTLRGRNVGLLEIDSTEANAFTEADTALLQKVATLLGGPMALARQVRDLQVEIAEHKRTEQRLAVQYGITALLADAQSFPQVAPSILQTVASLLGWDLGCVWCIDREQQVLRCSTTWLADTIVAPEFEAQTRQLAAARGVDLPGRVWNSARPLWIANLLNDPALPRRSSATQAGLSSGFAFPICGNNELFGAFEFWSRQARATDEELLKTAAGLGRQIGQFIDRKRAERARNESEKHRSAILGTALDGVVGIDHNGRITEFNPAAERMFGYRRDEALGQEMIELILPPDRNLPESQHFKHDLTTGKGYILGKRFETRAVRADGSEFPVELAITGVPTDGPPRFTGFIRDITERKRAEEAQRFLAESSRVLASSLDYEPTLQSVAHLTIPFLADWCIVDLLQDDGSVRLTAVAHVEPWKETLVHELREQYPPNHDEQHTIWHVLRSGHAIIDPIISQEQLAARAKDAQHLALLNAMLLRSQMVVPLVARGRILGTISLISAQPGRYSPDDLALVEDLGHRAALAIDNARLYGEAQAAIEIRNEFLSIASHELKTPLTTLLGHTQGLQRRLLRDNLLSERDQRAMQVIEQQALRLNKQIDTLLNLSRIELGQFSLEQQTIDLAALARQIATELEPTLERHTLESDIPETPLLISGDPARLEQVLQNLLQNAIKYSPNGGTVSLSIAQHNDRALITVSDQGVGIPESARPYLFQRFYRASNVTGRNMSGMGIGLYLVHLIVTLHHGTIEYRSAEDQGSTFIVRLPVRGHG